MFTRYSVIALLLAMLSEPLLAGDFVDISATPPPDSTHDAPKEQNLSHQHSVHNVLIYALSQLGVQYRYGGSSAQGFDCSGFVKHVFSRATNLVLPHSSRAMSHAGEQVSPTDLQPGDLVFFKTEHHRISHVGIYMGNQKFIHAASSRTGAVVISDLREHYWAHRFASARHLPLGESMPEDALTPPQTP